MVSIRSIMKRCMGIAEVIRYIGKIYKIDLVNNHKEYLYCFYNFSYDRAERLYYE